MTFTEIGANRNGYLNISERKRFGQEKKNEWKDSEKRPFMNGFDGMIDRSRPINYSNVRKF